MPTCQANALIPSMQSLCQLPISVKGLAGLRSPTLSKERVCPHDTMVKQTQLKARKCSSALNPNIWVGGAPCLA